MKKALTVLAGGAGLVAGATLIWKLVIPFLGTVLAWITGGFTALF